MEQKVLNSWTVTSSLVILGTGVRTCLAIIPCKIFLEISIVIGPKWKLKLRTGPKVKDHRNGHFFFIHQAKCDRSAKVMLCHVLADGPISKNLSDWNHREQSILTNLCLGHSYDRLPSYIVLIHTLKNVRKRDSFANGHYVSRWYSGVNDYESSWLWRL